MDLVIRNAINDSDGAPIEVGIRDGLIAAVAPGGLPPGDQEIDAAGGMLGLPGNLDA